MKNSILLQVLAAATVQNALASSESKLTHANHLFNAIHSSMRQWGSSLHHNGMSTFIATVPADTEFYHGTRSAYRINDTEWLAFEPEHAMLFAASLHGPPPGSHPKEPPLHPLDPANQLRMNEPRKPLTQVKRDSDNGGPPPAEHGYFHTYRTKGPLRLLYVDGQSAAKSRKGTLDMQDVVILRNQLSTTDERGKRPLHGGPMQEYERAQGLCRRAESEWQGLIDGIIRMEGGFEVILCSFEQHLDLVSIQQATKVARKRPASLVDVAADASTNMFNYYKAVAARFDGIGGDRVTINYDSFVSLFAHPEAVYFDKNGLPRAINKSKAMTDVREAIDGMVSHATTKSGRNWQAVADMVVDRYSDRIEYLASGDLRNLQAFQEETEHALRPFIDYEERDQVREIARCSMQFLPRLDVQELPLAGEVIKNVTSTICTMLNLASTGHSLDKALSTVRSLKAWLQWTTFKRCRGCKLDEVCSIPIWPAGTKADFDHPRCRSDMTWAPGDDDDDYW